MIYNLISIKILDRKLDQSGYKTNYRCKNLEECYAYSAYL